LILNYYACFKLINIYFNRYGKNDYDRKPIENVEQVTLRELYELTLSRIEARKSNVYYSNQAPNNDNPNFIDYFNGEPLSEQKINMIGRMEQEKIKNIDVDELEGKNKSIKKIKLDFDKAQTTLENNESKDTENESSSDDSEIIDQQKSTQDIQEDMKKDVVEKVQTNPVPTIEDDNTETITENNQQPSTETSNNSLPGSPEHPENNKENNTSKDRSVFHSNGEINYNNLPKKFVSPKRVESMNRRGGSPNINSPLDLAHYKPPLKSLEEINDPNYENFVGKEPVPYGSHVFYEEPKITSPNLEEAIPLYHRPQINYRDNLINMSYSHYYPDLNVPEVITPPTVVQESEKKKEKKKDRKGLNFLHILKKSKSAENVKGKSRMSLFKQSSKNDNEAKRNTSPPALNTSPKTYNTFPHNDTVDIKTQTLSRVSIVNNYQEPTLNDLVSDGPTLFNNENKTLSTYALKSLKLRQTDINRNHNDSPSPTQNSSHINVQKPNLNTYVPNIPLD